MNVLIYYFFFFICAGSLNYISCILVNSDNPALLCKPMLLYFERSVQLAIH
jgi:hypothetical protein